MKPGKKSRKQSSSHCCTIELLTGVSQQHKDEQREKGKGGELREKEVKRKIESATDRLTQTLNISHQTLVLNC